MRARPRTKRNRGTTEAFLLNNNESDRKIKTEPKDEKPQNQGPKIKKEAPDNELELLRQLFYSPDQPSDQDDVDNELMFEPIKCNVKIEKENTEPKAEEDSDNMPMEEESHAEANTVKSLQQKPDKSGQGNPNNSKRRGSLATTQKRPSVKKQSGSMAKTQNTRPGCRNVNKGRFELIFPCPSCEKVCKSKTGLEKHAKTHEKKVPITKAKPTAKSKPNSSKAPHGKPIFACTKCNVTCKSKTALEKHFLTARHNDGVDPNWFRKFFSAFVDEKWGNLGPRTRRPRGAHQPEWRFMTYRCTICKKVSTWRPELEAHVKKEHPDPAARFARPEGYWYRAY